MQKVRKAVIPAAGFGTRFLPQTKAIPKQMLPLVDKPIIQYIVEELVTAGIEDIIIVTNHLERAIEDHFDAPNQDLVENIKLGGPKKAHYLEEMEKISTMANFIYVRQKGPYGNGTPLLNVRHVVGDEPFLYVWSDEFVLSRPTSAIQQLLDAYQEFGCSILGAVRADQEKDFLRYGYAGGTEIRPGILRMDHVIEKPGKDHVPSSMAALVFAFLLTPSIFDSIQRAQERMKPGDELWYNDAIRIMIENNEQVLTRFFENARYYDCGTVLDYMKSATKLGLENPEMGEEFKQFLTSLVS